LSNDMFWTALWTNLFSPARGLFVFSPFFLLLIFNFSSTYRTAKENRSLLILVGWIVIHLILVSKFYNYWAGHSFGPRFMIDILPAIYLLFLSLVSHVHYKGSQLNRRLTLLFLIITVPVSVYFNAVQGLYNKYSGVIWNGNPNIDKHSEYLFDWKFPQFLHTKERHALRLAEFNMKNEAKERGIKFNSDKVVFIGWSEPEVEHRWSLGHKSQIIFRLTSFNTLRKSRLLTINVGSLGKQSVKVTLNDYYLGSQLVDSTDVNIVFSIPNELLNDIGDNTLQLEYSNAHKPNDIDQRVLAIALKSFRIE